MFAKNIGDCKITGDFSGLEKLIKELGSNYYVDIGILGESSYDNGATIAGIGAVHEFGSLSGNIPKRSWLLMPLEEKQKYIETRAREKLQKFLDEKNIKGLIALIGILGEEVIQESFETRGYGSWPDIKQKTKNAKGSDAILIDEGTLRKSVTSKVS